MAVKVTRLIAPNGVTVSVADEKVDRLIAQGFTAEKKTRPRTSQATEE